MFILNFTSNTESSLVENMDFFALEKRSHMNGKGAVYKYGKDLVSCHYRVNVAFFGSCSKNQGPLAMPYYIPMVLVRVPLFLSSMCVGG